MTYKGGGENPGSGERSRDEVVAWRQMLGDTQGPWPIMLGSGK